MTNQASGGEDIKDLDAMDALSRAKELYRDSPSPRSNLVIREILKKVLENPVALNPRQKAEAWAFLADVSTCDYLNRWNDAGPAELMRAEAAIRQAFNIIADLPLAHYVTGFIWRAKGDHKSALAAFDKTIKLDPGFIRAYAQKANELINVGEPQDTFALVQQAIERIRLGSPALGMFYWIIGRAHFYTGRLSDAIEWLTKSVEIRPNLWYNRLFLVSAYGLIGENAAASAALSDFEDKFPNYTIARVVLNEQANPNDHPVVVVGRQKFHEGLRLAGMPAE